MLTPFGTELRIFRLKHNELLKTMADKLKISPAYLSSVENGKKDPTEELLLRISSAYQLTESEYVALSEARARTLKEVKVKFQNEADEELGLLFARKLNSLSDKKRQEILNLLK